MVSERDAFLAAIRAAPDDDLPRLAFADWLDEHDEPGRAEFVRVQVALANWKPPYSPWCKGCGWVYEQCSCKGKNGHPPEVQQLDALRQRERELWAAGTRDFDAAFPGGLAGVLREFRRGFVEAITCPADWWLAHGDAIRRAHPVTRVTWTGWPAWHVEWGGDGFHWLFRDHPGEVYALRHDSPPEEDAGGLADICGELLAAYWPGVTFELPRSVPVPHWTHSP